MKTSNNFEDSFKKSGIWYFTVQRPTAITVSGHMVPEKCDNGRPIPKYFVLQWFADIRQKNR